MYFSQGRQNEKPFLHSGMGDSQFFGICFDITEGKDVDVYGPWFVQDGFFFSAERFLDLFSETQ